MEQQWDFFKQGETSLGIFYPLHYIVAGYFNLDDARAAENGFRDAGVTVEDVRTVDGEFVAAQLEARSDDRNWAEKLTNDLAAFIGTENQFIADDQAHARKGGAFLFVYAPDDDDLARARTVFSRHPALFARRYLRIAIETIIENDASLNKRTAKSP